MVLMLTGLNEALSSPTLFSRRIRLAFLNLLFFFFLFLVLFFTSEN